jgi:hypothetical protein
MYDNNLFADIKARLSIVEVAGLCGLELKISGRRFVCCCPVHAEKTASCTIYPEDGNFHCYGCHAHGDAIELFRIVKGYAKPIDAAWELARAAGIAVEEYKPHKAHSKPAQPPPPTDGQLVRAFEEWQKTAFYWLRKYRDWMDIILTELKPERGAEQLHPLFAEVLRNKDFVEYALDILAGGTDTEKLYLYKNFRKDVNEVVQRTHQIFGE